jgi:xanthine/CO dehydrogenase XdhC/CoxF family maturation factor
VADDREAFLTLNRFPTATDFVHTEPERVAQSAVVDRRTLAVVMSHNFLRDLGYLRSFLGTEVAYIGMLGPRDRLDRLLESLAREGVRPTEEDIRKIHGPAGLDLGAEGPEEIAAAIVGEILAVRRGRAAGFLKDRTGPIHDRAVKAGSDS